MTVTTSATQLTPTTLTGPDYAKGEQATLIQNTSSVDVFIGGPGVTSTVYGYRLAPGGDITLTDDLNDPFFAVVATGTALIHTLSTRA